jgi:hypothetical protein
MEEGKGFKMEEGKRFKNYRQDFYSEHILIIGAPCLCRSLRSKDEYQVKFLHKYQCRNDSVLKISQFFHRKSRKKWHTVNRFNTIAFLIFSKKIKSSSKLAHFDRDYSAFQFLYWIYDIWIVRSLITLVPILEVGYITRAINNDGLGW